MNACAHHGYYYQHCANGSTDPNAIGPSSFESGPLFEFVTEEPLPPLGCFGAPSAEANGRSIQSSNFVPRSPPCVCCFSSPPSSWRLGFVVVGSGVSMGPLGADMQPPPSSADSAWFLTQNSGFGLHDDDDETGPSQLGIGGAGVSSNFT